MDFLRKDISERTVEDVHAYYRFLAQDEQDFNRFKQTYAEAKYTVVPPEDLFPHEVLMAYPRYNAELKVSATEMSIALLETVKIPELKERLVKFKADLEKIVW